jgi:pyruvate/2-oxoglutarate dehydrogenase complex dihydrolipoamide acyltransferase (E2) component
MRKPIVMPDLHAASPILSVWLVGADERVYAGDRLVEILIAGATIDLPAPVSGRLVEKSALPDEQVVTGQVLGYIEEEE